MCKGGGGGWHMIAAWAAVEDVLLLSTDLGRRIDQSICIVARYMAELPLFSPVNVETFPLFLTPSLPRAFTDAVVLSPKRKRNRNM